MTLTEYIVDNLAAPSITGLIREVLLQRLSTLHTCIPAKVVTYDAGIQRASVLPLINNRVVYASGVVEEEPYEVIGDVPVVHLGGAGGILHIPLEEGDNVMLVVTEQAWEQPLAVNAQASPITSRRFDLADAIAFPALLRATPAVVHPSDIFLGRSTGGVHINTDGTINLAVTGAAADSPVSNSRLAAKLALLDLWVASATTAIQRALAAGVAAEVPTGGPFTEASVDLIAKRLAMGSWPGNVAVPKVKVDL